MYYSLRGTLVHADTESIAIDCHGVSYHCKVTLSTLNSLEGLGSEVKVYTYLSVRDNAMELYGFSTLQELSTFKLLIGVTGIGPRIGLGILSYLTPEQIAFSIASDDYKSLTSAPGVGKKTAQRIVLELKDKIQTDDIVQGISAGNAMPLGTGNISESISALVALGYGQTQAATALQGSDPEASVQDLIKIALKKLANN